MTTTLGALCARIYEAALAEYGDPDLAAVVTSTVLNELLAEGAADAEEEAA